MIELLVDLPSPIMELQHAPLPPKVLRARECAPTPFPFVVFTFELAIESIKELGGASRPHTVMLRVVLIYRWLCSPHSKWFGEV